MIELQNYLRDDMTEAEFFDLELLIIIEREEPAKVLYDFNKGIIKNIIYPFIYP